MADQADGLLSPWLRKQRINIVCPYLRGMVLDFGCGIGMLAEKCQPNNYFGIDFDDESLAIARRKFKAYRFAGQYPEGEQYDTIVLLAVIEHIKDPVQLLKELKNRLKKDGRIVLTTPHTFVEKIHVFGAEIGLFSKHASEEHDSLIDYNRMQEIATGAGLVIFKYKRFLFGANQFFAMEPAPSSSIE